VSNVEGSCRGDLRFPHGFWSGTRDSKPVSSDLAARLRNAGRVTAVSSQAGSARRPAARGACANLDVERTAGTALAGSALALADVLTVVIEAGRAGARMGAGACDACGLVGANSTRVATLVHSA
jgi:hypothetical protein